MKKREQYKKLVSFTASAVILLLLTGIFAYVWYHSYEDIGANYFVRGNLVVVGLYTLMIYCFFKIYGGFKVGFLRVFDVIYSQILSVICVNIITYLQLCLIGRWMFTENLLPIVYMTLVDAVAVIIWVFVTKWLYMKLYPPRRMLLIYGKYSPDDLVRKLSAREDKYDVEEMISIDQDMEEIMAKISRYDNVVLTDIPADMRNQLLKFCFSNNIRCYCVPKISDIMIRSAGTSYLFDTPLLVFRNRELTIEQRAMKRLFDIVMSLIAIIVASPIMLIIAFCIKLCDRGPVFFTQDRLTKDGKVFKVLKFRSMYVNREEREYCMTRKDDARVTPVGKVIRNIHFDELPQLFNILKGDMSFVGPRPECPKLAAKYCENIPEFSFRLKVKAGLTGFAQVYGKYNTTPYDKLKLDLTYIESYSFLLDLKLLMLTFKILFQKENTEGIESWQTNASRTEEKTKSK